MIGLPEHSFGEQLYLAKIYLETADHVLTWTLGDHSDQGGPLSGWYYVFIIQVMVHRKERGSMKPADS